MFTSALTKSGLVKRSIWPVTLAGTSEARRDVILLTNGFLLLPAYYLLKPVRESLILTENNAEARSYAVVVLLFALVPIYSRLYQC